jgi:hypothetical protein
MEFKLKSLRKLFGYTQTSSAKRIAAWTIFPVVTYQIVDKSRELTTITYDLVLAYGLLETWPYVIACALVVAITTQVKSMARKLRTAHKLGIGRL